MVSDSYIAIGTRGTSLTKLTALPPQLHDGENPLPNPRGKSRSIYKESHAWVTNENEAKTFKLYRLSDAVLHGHVIHIADIGWTMEKGERHRGEAFFPPQWKVGDSQPSLVAVRSATWDRTTLELRNPNNIPDVRGTFEFTRNPPSRTASLEPLGPPEPRRWTNE